MTETQPSVGDYALIGDCETATLVSRNGSIDWLCLPRFDSGACFAALVGSPENGRWQLAPHASTTVTRQYRPGTLILETKFRTADGVVVLIDFMPLRTSHPRIIRMVRGIRGAVAMHMDLAIRFDYGLTVPWVTRVPRRTRTKIQSLRAVSGPDRLVLHPSVEVTGEGLRTVSDFVVKAGQTIHFELQYGNSLERIPPPSDPDRSLKKTETWWKSWAARCSYKGQWANEVKRSLITLKALTYAPTGGIIAAPTTSLPEEPRGKRNWDYRYCWLRDATFTLLGFIHAGYHEEARQWKDWLVRSAAGSAAQVQVMYGPAGERLLREWEVPWLSGYRGAQPVHVGNAASEQIQLDLYGELADALHQFRVSGKKKEFDVDLQLALLDHLAKIWHEPDHGIWEIRGALRHYTHSKVMAWVAFDRTIRSAEQFGFEAPLEKWKIIRTQIHEDVCRHGYNPRLNSFVQHYGSKEADASLLLLPLLGFLPPTDPRIVGTVRRIERQLLHRGFVMRFKRYPDGRPHKPEGAFLPCSFWLADYYELVDRRAAARRLLKRLLSIRNDVGLYSEEYHLKSRQLVGNFPQALTHVSLVSTIINLHTPHGPAHQRANHTRKLPAGR